MDTKKRTNKKIWIALLLVVTIQVLFDPLSSLLDFGERVQAQIGLPYARHKWDAQGITHYKFDIHAYVPPACIVGGSVEVNDGVVVHTGPSTDVLTRGEPDLDPGFAAMEDLPLCNYKNYTVTSFFDILEQQLAKYPNLVTQISFDPEYGFISGFGFGSSGGNGLLSPRIYDCCGGFSIRNFQVLDE